MSNGCVDIEKPELPIGEAVPAATMVLMTACRQASQAELHPTCDC